MNWYCLCEGLDLLDGLNGKLLAPVFGLRLGSIVLAVRITMHNTLGVPGTSQDRARIKTQAFAGIRKRTRTWPCAGARALEALVAGPNTSEVELGPAEGDSRWCAQMAFKARDKGTGTHSKRPKGL
jgi:hypothetical protein